MDGFLLHVLNALGYNNIAPVTELGCSNLLLTVEILLLLLMFALENEKHPSLYNGDKEKFLNTIIKWGILYFGALILILWASTFQNGVTSNKCAISLLLNISFYFIMIPTILISLSYLGFLIVRKLHDLSLIERITPPPEFYK